MDPRSNQSFPTIIHHGRHTSEVTYPSQPLVQQQQQQHNPFAPQMHSSSSSPALAGMYVQQQQAQQQQQQQQQRDYAAAVPGGAYASPYLTYAVPSNAGYVLSPGGGYPNTEQQQQQQQQQGLDHGSSGTYPAPYPLQGSSSGSSYYDSHGAGDDTYAYRDTSDVRGSYSSGSSSLRSSTTGMPGAAPISYPIISAAAGRAAAAAGFPQHQPLRPPTPAAAGFSHEPPRNPNHLNPAVPSAGFEPRPPLNLLNPANWFKKPPPPPKPSPLQVAAARMGQRVVWTPRRAPNPFKLHFSPVALLLFLGFLTAAGYYFYVRIAFSLNMGSHTWYGVLVLVVELIGLTSVIPYGMLLPLHTLSSGSKGLPVDDGRVVLPPEKRFRVHILVPCYKESLSVITNTVTAALAAEVPPGVTRILYLCDDGKDPAKAEFIASLGEDARYVTGRTRTPGEINGKSANVNNCLRNVIFPEYDGRPQDIPLRELVVVFDADMAARRNFLLKVLEAMWDDSCSLCLTPQAFSNINPRADIFNNINQQFWEYVLPGCDALGYIACTGTNFCLRARSLGQVGWFPEYTITEDYALSMELKAAGFKGRYLAEYLAVGEAPDEIRNVCRQRSRWTKGHMQIFFSRRCPLTNWKLPLIHKILYTNGTWAYFCTIITTLVFLFVPFNSLVFGYHPVVFSYEFALAATVYLPLNFLLMNFVRKPQHIKGQWMAQISNHILTFTYIKAVFNTLLSIVGWKAKAGFKATDKSGGTNPIAAIKTLGGSIKATMARAGSGGLPTTSTASAPAALSAAAAAAAAAAAGPRTGPGARPPMMSHKVVVGADGIPRVLPPRPMTKSELIQAQLKQQQQQQKKKPRRGCWVWINAKTLEGALDPLFLAFSLCVSLAALAAGIYTIIKNNAFDFTVNSWSDFTQIFTAGRLDVYILVPMLWALYNAIPPLLFFVYFFTKGRLLQGLCSFMQVFGLVLAAVAVGSLWLGMLMPYKGAVTPAPISAISQSLNNAISKTLSNVPNLPPGSRP